MNKFAYMKMMFPQKMLKQAGDENKETPAKIPSRLVGGVVKNTKSPWHAQTLTQLASTVVGPQIKRMVTDWRDRGGENSVLGRFVRGALKGAAEKTNYSQGESVAYNMRNILGINPADKDQIDVLKRNAAGIARRVKEKTAATAKGVADEIQSNPKYRQAAVKGRDAVKSAWSRFKDFWDGPSDVQVDPSKAGATVAESVKQ